MTLRRTLLIAPLLGACSVLPDRPYVETRRFPLEPRRSAPPRSGRARRSLLVRTIRPGAGMEARNLRTIRPLDRHTILESVKKTNRIVSVEEGWPFAGIGAEIAALIGEHAFDYLDAPLKRVCGADVPLPYAAGLEKLALPQAEHIVAAVKEVCYKA